MSVVSRIAVAACLLAACGGSTASVDAPPRGHEDTSLGAGDVFEIRVYGEEDLGGEYRVANDGSIDFPLIGRTAVAGLEPQDVADLLEDRLREGQFLRHPHVSILVSQYNSKQVSVVGAVSKPGTFPLTTGMTVLQAITAAGGFTALASQNQTIVTRVESGERRRYVIRAGDVSAGEATDVPLRQGDIVYVPERIF